MSTSEMATAQGEVTRPAARRRRDWEQFLTRYTLVLILVAMVAGFSIAMPDTFFTTQNFTSILNEQVIVLLLAVGVVAPFVVGEFDLSIGYILGLSQAFAVGAMAKSGLPIALSMVIALVLCCGVGLINGIVVVKGKVNAIITTLGVGSVLSGIVFAYTDGQVIFEHVPPSFVKIARSELLGIPLPVFYAAAIVLALEILFTYTSTGRRLFAIGGNRQAAVLSGIRVEPLIIMTFVLSALLSGLAGVLLASRLGTAQPDTGPSFLLPAFAAVFLGATTIRPGRFNVLGTVVAVYVLAVPISGLQQLGVPSWFQSVFNGVALVVAVACSNQFGALRERRARRARLRAFREGREVHVAEAEAVS
jgi:ribose transport system permease protein